MISEAKLGAPRAGYMARGQRVAAEWGGGPARLGPNQSSQLAAFLSTSNYYISYISDYIYIYTYIYIICI